MAGFLRQTPASNLHVFVVWEPILPTDWGRPATGVLGRLNDPRAVQFWDSKHLISRALQAEMPAGEPPCCRQNGALWDVVALFAPGEQFGRTPPAFVNGPVVDSVSALRSRLAALAAFH